MLSIFSMYLLAICMSSLEKCLTEAEDIKKRWQEYTELYKKDLHDQDNHDGVIAHSETDILESSQVGLTKHHYEQS